MKPDAIRIYEVSPRDGLQNEAQVVPTDVKVALIARLVAAGIQDIEVSSFVRASWIPLPARSMPCSPSPCSRMP